MFVVQKKEEKCYIRRNRFFCDWGIFTLKKCIIREMENYGLIENIEYNVMIL